MLEEEDFESPSDVWMLEQRLSKTRRMRESAERALGLLKDPSKAAEFNSSKATWAMSRLKDLEKSENKFSLLLATKTYTDLKRDLKSKGILLD